MEKHMEGLVVKALDSPYDIGARASTWIKVKPEYGGHTRDLDMIVVGAHYGSGGGYRGNGQISKFTCAVVEKDMLTNRIKYHTACRVATGYNLQVRPPRRAFSRCLQAR